LVKGGAGFGPRLLEGIDMKTIAFGVVFAATALAVAAWAASWPT
jgi:hypothetical protein